MQQWATTHSYTLGVLNSHVCFYDESVSQKLSTALVFNNFTQKLLSLKKKNRHPSQVETETETSLPADLASSSSAPTLANITPPQRIKLCICPLALKLVGPHHSMKLPVLL